MAFFVVLHHPRDRAQPWANAWSTGTDDRIEAITTTPAIAKRCDDEGRVFVHRCGFEREAPAVVCQAEVLGVERVDAGSRIVRFKTIRTMHLAPALVPVEGQNFYVAEEPPPGAADG